MGSWAGVRALVKFPCGITCASGSRIIVVVECNRWQQWEWKGASNGIQVHQIL